MNSLPKLSLPLFELVLPSTGKKIQYRPFTVKEEKILLIAQESKEIDQIILAIKQIITNCTVNVDVDKLATFDFEYILLHIRGKSVNNVIDLNITDPDTKERIALNIDINDIQLKTFDGHQKNIKIDQNTMLVMRYPTLDELAMLSKAGVNSETLFNIMIRCIDQIVVGDSIYNTIDFDDTQLVEFADQLTPNVITDIQKFFETAPVLRAELKYTNKEGTEKTFVMEGMETFFM